VRYSVIYNISAGIPQDYEDKWFRIWAVTGATQACSAWSEQLHLIPVLFITKLRLGDLHPGRSRYDQDWGFAGISLEGYGLWSWDSKTSVLWYELLILEIDERYLHTRAEVTGRYHPVHKSLRDCLIQLETWLALRTCVYH
jgi:hypothetical protein